VSPGDLQISEAAHAEPELIDVQHLGNPRVIGVWRVGDVLIDSGPSSSLAALLPILEAHPPRVLALTHIHLDHAGASGTLARRFPEMEIWVHERGARHLVSPEKLLASAGRLYGDQMERLWGEFLPVPEDRLRVLSGDETLGPFRVAYTPGHASHHVSYLHEPSGRAYTGDVTGVRVGDGPVLAPTPPPDIDLGAWRESLDLIEAWHPHSLAPTHFGAFEDVEGHLAAIRRSLDEAEQSARGLDEAAFVEEIRARIASSPGAADAAVYAQAVPRGQSYRGLERYLQGLERDAHSSRADG
jgi:glyoxylase-like metal-dependent hydrolase (beta-lactamase superfamily II)